jgi:hypothetical protein
MTKAELREAIKQEARAATSTNLDDLIDQIVTEITRDYTNKSRYEEAFIFDAEIICIDATGIYDLPEDFQNIEEIRFGRGPDATYYKRLLTGNTQIRRRSIVGYPLYFFLSSGRKINLHPYDAILATDSLLLSYWSDVTIAYNTSDDNEFPIPRLESVVKKDAIARIQRFHLDFPSSDRMSKDAGSSFIAAESR